MGMRFTDEQQSVIDARGQNLLVSAAAGSGKTAVLVERIIRLITEPDENGAMTDIDRLLVVTFTRAAAQQMKELEESGCNLILRNTRSNAEGDEVAVYDIDVSLSDNSWTVELPHVGYTYTVSLVSCCDGKETVICQSTSLTTTSSWLAEHSEELGDDITFRMILSSLIRKGGEVIANSQVQALVNDLQNGTFGENQI